MLSSCSSEYGGATTSKINTREQPTQQTVRKNVFGGRGNREFSREGSGFFAVWGTVGRVLCNVLWVVGILGEEK